MATGITELIDVLFTMIDEAKNAPLSSEKCVIERDKALDILDDIKDQLPVELAEARKIVNARNEYVAAAKREADEIRRRAEVEARQMVDTDQVVGMARQQAAEVMRQAEVKSRELSGFELISETRVRYPMHLDSPEKIKSLFMMTPYAYRTGREERERVLSLRELDLEADFYILVYKKCD